MPVFEGRQWWMVGRQVGPHVRGDALVQTI
jgi:hypothetical protein